MAHGVSSFVMVMLLAAAPRAVAQRDGALAITNVTVIPMDRERVLRAQTVVVRGETIEEVGPSASVKIPAGARRIDGSGRFLIPGLVDAHVHYVDDDPRKDARVDRINREYNAMFLAAGVTEVMNLCGSPGNLALRDSIAREEVVGPTVLTSPHCLNDSLMTDAQGDSAAVASKKAGYDFLKVYSFLSVAGFEGIIRGAHRVGIPVIGHIPQRVGTQRMLESGAANVVHAEEFLYNAPFRLAYGDAREGAVRLDTMDIAPVVHAVRVNGVAVTPTLVAYSTILDEAVDLRAVLARRAIARMSADAKASREWDVEHNTRAQRLSAAMPLSRLRLGLAMQRRLVRALRDSGVTLLAGTDAGGTIPMAPGWALHDELQLLVNAGLSPYEALRAATANAGEFFARSFHAEKSGTITPGARADLVLLAANPLEDIANTRRIRGVVVRGRWLGAGTAH